MSDAFEGTWSAPGKEIPLDERLVSAERQLALVDRILGLEAQLAQASTTATLTPSEQLSVEKQLEQIRSSNAFRVGRIAILPLAMARRMLSRVLNR